MHILGKETLEQQEETVVAAQHSGAPLPLIIGIPVWVGWVAEDSQKIPNVRQTQMQHRHHHQNHGLGLCLPLGVPILLAYVNSVFPICRSGSCGVLTVKIFRQEGIPPEY